VVLPIGKVGQAFSFRSHANRQLNSKLFAVTRGLAPLVPSSFIAQSIVDHYKNRSSPSAEYFNRDGKAKDLSKFFVDKRKKNVIVGTTGDVSTWRLTNLSDNTSIVGQFPPDDWNLDFAVSSTYGEIASTGTKHPIQQFIRGNLETISFSSMFISQVGKPALDSWRVLETLVRPSQIGNVPPICTFTYGTEISLPCKVQSARTTRILTQDDGSIRQIVFSVELSRHTDPLQGAPEPLVTKKFPILKTILLRKGDTFEHVAKMVYGSARLGPSLRKLYPGVEKSLRKGKPRYIDIPTTDWLSTHYKPTSRIFRKTKNIVTKRKEKIEKKLEIIKNTPHPHSKNTRLSHSLANIRSVIRSGK